MISIFTDGGARGNPGPAAIGVAIFNSKGEELVGIGKTLGIATNNVAEYSAVIEALKWLAEHKPQDSDVHFYLDSELVVSQLNGVYKVKNDTLRGLLFGVRELIGNLPYQIVFSHIPREKNKRADSLVNFALDNA